jgi:hypothetical protein
LVTPLLGTSGDTGAFAARWQPLAKLLEAMQRPRKPMTPVCRKGNATPSLTAASTATSCAGRALARWVAIDAEYCPAHAVTGEDIDPEAYVVGNS